MLIKKLIPGNYVFVYPDHAIAVYTGNALFQRIWRFVYPSHTV